MLLGIELNWMELEVSLPVVTDNPLFGSRQFFVWVERDIADLLLLSIAIISGVVFAFSKEKREDEMITSIRKDSLIWAFYFNYAVLIISIFLISGFDLFLVLALNMLSLLMFFIVRFQWQKRLLKNSLDAE
ncbi:hypothetical protein NMS_1787 [Nonlabens marinus S1-08]|uniref:Uncharacterized protein n=2 Tax=Nonlabens TaxID=363408 RepID=W8W067_9FLAO|nr:hypothetical protein NMS_1787 [Nonlabens marinus S1-08]